MNKGIRVFIKIFYYAFGIVAGIILAVVLPRALYNDLPFEVIKESIDSKDFKNAIRMYGGYFDSDIVYQNEANGKGIVIFASATLEANEEGLDAAKIKKAYSGFIYGIKNSESMVVLGEDKPTLIAYASDETIYDYNIINCNAYVEDDEEDTLDSIYTLQIGYDYIFFNFRTEDIIDIKKIELKDNTNTLLYGIDDLSLKFSEQFFIDVDEFVNVYNEDYSSTKLKELDKEFRSKDESYMMSYNDDLKSRVNTKACIIILIYFICLYALGDCLVGKHYIIASIKKLIKKFKKEEKKSESLEMGFGDYYTQVTFKLFVPSDCDASFLVTYSNETNTIEFPLTKSQGYSVTKRVHSGIYVNAWVEVDGYQAIDFPKTIEVRGFNKTFTATFTKINKDNNMTEEVENK